MSGPSTYQLLEHLLLRYARGSICNDLKNLARMSREITQGGQTCITNITASMADSLQYCPSRSLCGYLSKVLSELGVAAALGSLDKVHESVKGIGLVLSSDIPAHQLVSRFRQYKR